VIVPFAMMATRELEFAVVTVPLIVTGPLTKIVPLLVNVPEMFTPVVLLL
jgi:hypothetical protein